MSSTSEIVSVAIYPGIGVARVGNSESEYFIGPEVPFSVPKPSGFYRDASGALKRQAARFRVYGFDAQGNVVREITNEARIRWTVEVANTKAAWYQFVTAMDIPQAVSVGRRNAAITGDARRQLEITPPPRSIEGLNQSGDQFTLMGEFCGETVYLGELATDEAGRLLFLGGRGVSRPATPGGKPYTFANNDGWHDDVSDGTVKATVYLNERTLEAKPAWVIVGPPNYAPELLGVVTMYDILANTYIGNWYAQKKRPSFTQDIFPILERFCSTQWVNQGFFVEFGWQGPYDFMRQIEILSSPKEEYAERRRQIFNRFRYPQRINPNLNITAPNNTGFSAGPSIGDWPVYYGDAVSLSSINPNAYLSVTELMYQYLSQWAAGDFDADWEGIPAHPVAIDEVTLAEQPATLDRAAMEFCLGGPFHPGCELTWPMRNYTIYSEPFRIREWPTGVLRQDYGDQLTPDQVFNQGTPQGPTLGGPLYFQRPGDLTRWMAVPWQTDTSSCRSGYAPEYDPYLPTFWPQRVPNQVLTEATYEAIMQSPPEQGLAEFQNRAIWYRFLGPDTDYLGQIDTMISRFGDLGIIERRPGPGHSELPAEMFVETGVQFDQPVPEDRGKVMLTREKVSGVKRY